MKTNTIKTIILFIIIIGFILFSSTAIKVIEGLNYSERNQEIIDLSIKSNLLRNNYSNRGIICCDNYTYAPNVKCVKQLDQNTCKLPNTDGTCSGDNYTSEELGDLKNGNELETCKIPLTHGNYLTNSSTVTTVDTLEPVKVKKTKKKEISIGDKVTFKLKSTTYNGYVLQINGDLYLIQYNDNGTSTTTSVKKKNIKKWESGKVYMDNLLYGETYSPNNYAFFSRESEKCCFDAPQKILNTTDQVKTIPEQYQCPIGWDLVTNVCTDTCGPCTNRTEDTPESVTFPNSIKKSKTIEDNYVYTNIIDNNENYGYHTLTAAPFLL